MKRNRIARVAALAGLCLALVAPLAAAEEPAFTDTFPMSRKDLKTRGVNPYFMPLTPGYSLLLQGHEDSEEITVLITVLRKTRVVAGVKCRVVREMEWVDGELIEVSWNYFAISKTHKGVFYFGEEVDIYEDGEVVSHDGAWLAGVDGARPGLIMPGYPLVGSRYYQEVAPGVALDRAEHLSTTDVVNTPAGIFGDCLVVEETTPLEPGEASTKAYAPGIGLIQDDVLLLVDYGFDVEFEPDDD